MPFLPFIYGYPSFSPHAHCTPNKSVPTLRYTRRHGPPIYVYTGPCPKALTECSPLDFRRSSVEMNITVRRRIIGSVIRAFECGLCFALTIAFASESSDSSQISNSEVVMRITVTTNGRPPPLLFRILSCRFLFSFF